MDEQQRFTATKVAELFPSLSLKPRSFPTYQEVL
jgi:hypothetical protein